jgi:hypothetical protein
MSAIVEQNQQAFLEEGLVLHALRQRSDVNRARLVVFDALAGTFLVFSRTTQPPNSLKVSPQK